MRPTAGPRLRASSRPRPPRCTTSAPKPWPPNRPEKGDRQMNLVPLAPMKAARPRIAPLSTLPVFYTLAGKRVLVAGGSAPAAWKAELLAAAGAQVHVAAPLGI